MIGFHLHNLLYIYHNRTNHCIDHQLDKVVRCIFLFVQFRLRSFHHHELVMGCCNFWLRFGYHLHILMNMCRILTNHLILRQLDKHLYHILLICLNHQYNLPHRERVQGWYMIWLMFGFHLHNLLNMWYTQTKH